MPMRRLVSHPILKFMAAGLLLCAGGGAALAGGGAFAVGADADRLQWGPCPAFMPEGCEIAVLHGDPAQPNADIFFRVPGGAVIPHHRHTSAERMVLVSGEMEVDYDGQEAAVVRAGDYAYGPPGLPHSARCLSEGPCTLFIAFEQPIDAMPVEAE